MSDIIDTLVEMGFDKAKSELAVSKTGARDVQEAMEWLLAHADEIETPPVGESSSTTETNEVSKINDVADADNAANSANAANTADTANVAESTDTTSDASAEAKSLKCDECGKLFKSQMEVEFHAAKSGHSAFSESTEEKKPLTEEEKQEQKARLEKLMAQKRKERDEKEKQDALEREKNRIRSGKEMIEAKRKQEETEMKKLIDQRKREKQEEKLARQRVRDQIEQDKLARKVKFGGQAEAATAAVVPVPEPAKPVALTTSLASKNYTEARLQIRLTNGSSLTQTFGAKEPLSAVRLYVEMNRTDEPGPFSLMTSFPRKTFNTDDYDKPLDLLGLTPSAVIIVTKC